MKHLFYLFFLFGIIQSSSGQNVKEYFTYLTDLENTGQYAQAESIRNLYDNIFETVYLQDDKITTNGITKPTRLLTSPPDLKNWLKATEIVDYSRVKILIINFRSEAEINSSYFPPEFIQALTSLQYIVYVPQINASLEQFEGLIPVANAGVTQLYRKSYTE